MNQRSFRISRCAHPPCSRARHLAASVALIWLILSGSLHANAVDDGIVAFRAGHYEQALTHFRAARTDGLDTPVLRYNIGVTLFRLGRYRDAAAAFESVTTDPQWGALAHFNLGLVEERLGRHETARTHFLNAFQQADSPAVVDMAAERLLPREPSRSDAATPRPDSSWKTLMSLSGGYEDNVLLSADNAAGGAIDEDDYFGELLLLTSGYVQGNARRGWRMELGGYYRGYRELDEFNLGVATAGLFHEREIGNWRWQSGVEADLQFFGGDHFTTTGTLRLQGARDIGAMETRLRNDASYIDGADPFDHVSGWRTRTTLDIITRRSAWDARAGYELELNERDGLTFGGEHFDYSPVRHRFFLDTRLRLSTSLAIDARAEYQGSAWRGTNIEVNDDNTVSEGQRGEDRLSGTLRLTWRTARDWHLFAEYQHADNDANFARYRYASSQVLAGFEWGL